MRMKKDIPADAAARRISNRGNFFVLGAIIFSCAMAFLLVYGVTYSSKKSRQMEAEKLAFLCASEIEQVCTRTFQLNEIVAELVIEDERTSENFSRIAPRLLKDYPAADSVQLAPNGVVEQIIPLSGNEAAIGHDLFADQERLNEVVVARKSGRLSVAGPYMLKQGWEGFIGRLPVFRDVWKTDFWGFVNVVIRISKLVESADFSIITSRDYTYSVYRIEEESNEIKHIFGSPLDSLKNPVVVPIQNMPNANWEIAVAPKGLWVNLKLVLIVAILSIFVIFLIGILALLATKNRANEKFASLIGIDPLTGLYSKKTVLNSLRKEIDYASRNSSQLAVCRIDAHGVDGDSDLIGIADKILGAVRSEDIVARFGAEEFLVILRGKYTGTDYKPPLQRIQDAVSAHRGVEKVSVGLAVYPKDGESVEKLVQCADDSKRGGK